MTLTREQQSTLASNQYIDFKLEPTESETHETINKNTMGETAHKLNALDNATDVGDVKIKKINSKIYQAVIKGRVAKKWDRKTLAQQINVPPKAIEELETGKAKYDIKFIQKLERKLGIKLTGKEFQ